MTKRIEHVCNGEICPDEHCDPVNEMKPETIEIHKGSIKADQTRTPEGTYKLQTADPSGYGRSVGQSTNLFDPEPPVTPETFIEFNKLATMIHADNVKVGWWDDPDRCLLEVLQMVSTEIAEATEGERKDLMDDKLKHRKMGEVELADTLIRVLDLGGKLGLEYHNGVREFNINSQMVYKIKSTNSIAGKHFVINLILAQLHYDITYHLEYPSTDIHRSYSSLIESIMEVGKFRGYDIISALHEKLAYNRHRLDHKRENRTKKHGKKF